MNRPHLTTALTPQQFAAWYWLKEEMIAFCRENSISPTGSKLELANRIISHLAGNAPTPGPPKKRRAARMPQEFTMATVIGEGWRCGPALGSFLKGELGAGFHFNAEMRDFIHNVVGKTLTDAAICYQHSVRPGRRKAPIPSQLEYNQHFRDYFQKYPNTSREDAIAAWWARRGKPSSEDG